MPDAKITALTAISVIDPAVDPLPIVDVSDTAMAASGTTKKITINQILGASGTATLASATITGDLTVATNRFAVSASGVGIGTTTMTYNLNVTGGAPTVTGIKLINTSGTSSNLCMFSAGSAYSSFGVPNNAGWLAVEGSNPLAIGPTGNGGIVFVNNGSEAMRLNSAGLGVGVTPSAIASVTRLEIQGSISSHLTLRTASTNASARNWMVAANVNAFGDFVIRQGNSQGAEPNSGTDRLVIDPSGNMIPLLTSTPPTLATNNQMVFNLTSNTNLRISVRGSDGVTRVANITLA